MSLLMDALKRAERNKQDEDTGDAGTVTLPDPDGELALEPAAPEPAAAEPAADAIDAPARPAAEEPAGGGPADTPGVPADGSPAAAARVMAGAAGTRRRPGFTQALFTGVSLLVVVAAIVTAYHYWNLKQLPAQPPELALLGELTPAAAEPGVEPTAESAAPAAAPAPDRAASTTETELYAPVPRTVLERPAPEPENPVTTVDTGTAAPAREPVLRITRSRPPAAVHGRLQDAWEALNAGRLEEAAALYRQVLQRRPRNRDALLGLAAVRVRQGDEQRARGHYRRLLALDPTDTAAHAGLAALDGARDPLAHESRIKLLLRQNPDAAHLHFALGNLYARQQRWPRAQQAYFEAVRLAPDNPDYAFNLAVSLEHLDQPALALRYYRQALDNGRRRTAGFDPARATERIHRLEAATAGAPS